MHISVAIEASGELLFRLAGARRFRAGRQASARPSMLNRMDLLAFFASPSLLFHYISRFFSLPGVVLSTALC